MKQLLAVTAFVSVLSACGNNVSFQESTLGSLGVCNGVSCELTPLTYKPSVITILLALGDQVDSQLIVNQASNQLIAETVVRYASPKSNPKILVVIDSGAGTEDPEDSVYVAEELLTRYDARVLTEPKTGLTDADLVGVDVVWFNNPGTLMGLASTRDVLLRFAGGVILQGDDLTQGNKFSLEALTGLKNLDNGASVVCDDGKSYPHNDNNDYQYRVSLDPAKIPGGNSSSINFVYGNDIDDSVAARPGLEVLATARGGPAVCTAERPTIVRYLR